MIWLLCIVHLRAAIRQQNVPQKLNFDIVATSLRAHKLGQIYFQVGESAREKVVVRPSAA